MLGRRGPSWGYSPEEPYLLTLIWQANRHLSTSLFCIQPRWTACQGAIFSPPINTLNRYGSAGNIKMLPFYWSTLWTQTDSASETLTHEAKITQSTGPALLLCGLQQPVPNNQLSFKKFIVIFHQLEGCVAPFRISTSQPKERLC